MSQRRESTSQKTLLQAARHELAASAPPASKVVAQVSSAAAPEGPALAESAGEGLLPGTGMETDCSDAAASERGLLKIGDLCRLTQKTARTLHFYEELEILRPVERTRGGFRLYAQEAVTRIWLIERLQLLGLSLPEIRELLHGWEISETGSSAAHKVLSVLMARRLQLRAELERLHMLERELDETVEYLRHCVSGCSAHTGPQACTRCAHAVDEDVRPKMISGIYPFLA